MMAAWSQLPNDVWYVIGEKLKAAVDRIRFRSVCRTWRSVLAFPQPPWLMLAEDDDNPTTRGFIGLGQQSDEAEDQKVYQFELPEAYKTMCFGSTGTWFITIDLQERIFLLNPFSRFRIDLPSNQTFEFGVPRDVEIISPEALRRSAVKKAIISSPPSSPDCMVVVIFWCNRNLAYARPGDAVWTTIPTPIKLFRDIIFYRNQIYGINIFGQLMAVSLGDDSNPRPTTLLTNDFIKKVHKPDNEKYLVEWMGELLFVIKFMNVDDDDDNYQLNRFEVYQFDFAKREWNELSNLGEYALFLGFNTSVALLTSRYPGLSRNCIYFTDDFTFGYFGAGIPGGRDMGVFDLQDKSVRPHYKGTSTSLISPPLWIIPHP